jgi:hypothetical protein
MIGANKLRALVDGANIVRAEIKQGTAPKAALAG